MISYPPTPIAPLLMISRDGPYGMQCSSGLSSSLAPKSPSMPSFDFLGSSLYSQRSSAHGVRDGRSFWILPYSFSRRADSSRAVVLIPGARSTTPHTPEMSGLPSCRRGAGFTSVVNFWFTAIWALSAPANTIRTKRTKNEFIQRFLISKSPHFMKHRARACGLSSVVILCRLARIAFFVLVKLRLSRCGYGQVLAVDDVDRHL